MAQEARKHQFQRAPTKYHVIVVRAMTAEGPWETWFYRRQDKFERYTEKQKLCEATLLKNKIYELMETVSNYPGARPRCSGRAVTGSCDAQSPGRHHPPPTARVLSP